jgi:hypothetical protein
MVVCYRLTNNNQTDQGDETEGLAGGSERGDYIGEIED